MVVLSEPHVSVQALLEQAPILFYRSLLGSSRSGAAELRYLNQHKVEDHLVADQARQDDEQKNPRVL